MMPAARMDDILDNAFDDHPSVTASLEDFEEQPAQRSPLLFDLPSQHSGFRSERDDTSDIDDRSSTGGPWSPPGFRHARSNAARTSGWFRQDPYGSRPNLQPSLSPSRSRQTSPEYQDALEGEDEDVTLAANIPLPTGTDSPWKERSPEPEEIFDDARRSPEPPEVPNNYIRFAVRAEVQHREPFVALFTFLRSKIDAMTSTTSSTLLTIFVTFCSLIFFRILFVPPPPLPVPDLVKLSTMAKSFEPLIFYSENGYTQITALQETSVAVWDLGESVRAANMTSAPLIVRSLDELSDSLKNLGLELTRFFSNVDSDIDSILLVMDWSKRELASISAVAPPSFTTSNLIIDNLHALLNRGGLLENPQTGASTPLGLALTNLFGATTPQRTRITLIRTFHEFLGVLEEAINNELTHSTALFALFESIDRQFLNLQRTVIRETDTQERLENDLLSSLWTRLMGPNAAILRKYEKNKLLLSNVRARTVSNKHLLMDHHGRLQTLKINLETLRRKLVSPLIRRNNTPSGTLSGFASAMRSPMAGGDGSMRKTDGLEGVVEEQIRGLEGTYEYLRQVREKQKNKLLEMVYGARGGKVGLVGDSGMSFGGVGIDAR